MAQMIRVDFTTKSKRPRRQGHIDFTQEEIKLLPEDCRPGDIKLGTGACKRRLSERFKGEFTYGTPAMLVFHDSLHKTDTPHWYERRKDAVYMLWGHGGRNVARVPMVSMNAFPIGTRIKG